jgi:hypothetical protein
MGLERLVSLASRLFFLGAFLLLGLALVEKVANTSGYTIMELYRRSDRMLEAAVVLLIFVIAIQLREIRDQLKRRS